MSLFGRVVELDIGTAGSTGKRFTGLHVDFRVESGMNGEPGKAKITAYNLGEDTIGRLQAPGALVRLSVGYQGEPARLVFSGTPTKGGCKIERRGADLVTEIEAADGAPSYAAQVRVAFSRPVTVAEVWAEVTRQIGAPAGYTMDLPDRQMPRGVTLQGPARDVLGRLAGMVGGEVVIRDGALSLLSRGRASGESAIVFSAAAGNLIGAPSRTDDGVEVKALIAPTMRPGRPFRVTSERITGDFRAESVTFDGSSYGQSFYVQVKGAAL